MSNFSSFQKIRHALVSAKWSLNSIDLNTDIGVEDLIIPSRDQAISDTVESIIEGVEEKNPIRDEAIEYINRISLELPECPETFLESYK